MTIQELYEWAKENNALEADLSVYDSYGEHTSNIEPEIIIHHKWDDKEHEYTDEIAYIEAEL